MIFTFLSEKALPAQEVSKRRASRSLAAIFAIFALSLFLPKGANAQVEIRPTMGMNLTELSKTPDDLSSQARLGVQIGASALFGQRLYLQPGAYWFSRSVEFSRPGDTNFDQSLNGVLLNMWLGYRFIDPEQKSLMNVRLFAGPAMMFLNKAELSDGELNESIDWNQSQWGTQVGLGLDIAIFFFDIGYEAGLSASGAGETGSSFSDLKNNTFFINTGIILRF